MASKNSRDVVSIAMTNLLPIVAFLVLFATVANAASSPLAPSNVKLPTIDGPASLMSAFTLSTLFMLDASIVVFKSAALITGAAYLFLSANSNDACKLRSVAVMSIGWAGWAGWIKGGLSKPG
ncbi:hypothetical protein BC830DRAFT_1175009 [Chytriomyces sp. MP71]|nr:hypothetical protein BC830DRAFT_1175009 [Chytriomyces sp. MP71]